MFPNRLKPLRLSRKLSQQDMADFLGITRQGYAKYESGESSPNILTLNKLADFFDVSVDYLIGRPTNGEITSEEKRFMKDSEELNMEELIDKYKLKIDGRRTTKEELEGILAYVRTYREIKEAETENNN